MGATIENLKQQLFMYASPLDIPSVFLHRNISVGSEKITNSSRKIFVQDNVLSRVLSVGTEDMVDVSWGSKKWKQLEV